MKIYLDLLPKQKKAELKRKKIFHIILREGFLFMTPIFIFIVILFNIYYLLLIKHETSVAAKSVAESQDKYQELSSYEEKFKQANDFSTKLLKIQTAHLRWSEIFKKVSDAVPDGISMSDFSTKDFKMFLIGKAKSRDILLNFKSNLENDSCFSNINVPLSNLVVKNDIDFQIDLSIKKECLRKK